MLFLLKNTIFVIQFAQRGDTLIL